MRMRIVGPCLLLAVFLTGCGAYHAFDPQKPDAYYQYWKNEDNKQTSIVYPLTTECREPAKPEPKTG